jgi:hypothetical protein
MVMERLRSNLDLPPRELAQRHADDVVLAAALFKPNAPGNSELTWAGHRQRQVMKARGTYLGEIVVLAVTPLDVFVIEALQGRVHRAIRTWSRHDLSVATVTSYCGAPDPRWPALLISSRNGRQLGDVQAVNRDEEAERVGQLLLTANLHTQE